MEIEEKIKEALEGRERNNNKEKKNSRYEKVTDGKKQ
jgi:hypothetical protein